MSKSTYIIIALVILIASIGVLLWQQQSGQIQPKPEAQITTQPKADRPLAETPIESPTMTPTPTSSPFDNNKIYTATLHTTAGDITISLNAKQTPITAGNFVTLAQKKFYDNTIFHRVLKGFMIQGGDPKGDGTGGPGYTFNDEPFTGDYTRGTVAMANAGPNTNGSQFFIMHEDYPLPKNYVIFGHVSAGMETVDKIATEPVTTSPSGEPSKPVTPVTVTSVDIAIQ